MPQCAASWIASADPSPLWLPMGRSGALLASRYGGIEPVPSLHLASPALRCSAMSPGLPLRPGAVAGELLELEGWYYIEDFDVCAEFLVTSRAADRHERGHAQPDLFDPPGSGGPLEPSE